MVDYTIAMLAKPPSLQKRLLQLLRVDATARSPSAGQHLGRAFSDKCWQTARHYKNAAIYAPTALQLRLRRVGDMADACPYIGRLAGQWDTRPHMDHAWRPRWAGTTKQGIKEPPGLLGRGVVHNSRRDQLDVPTVDRRQRPTKQELATRSTC